MEEERTTIIPMPLGEVDDVLDDAAKTLETFQAGVSDIDRTLSRLGELLGEAREVVEELEGKWSDISDADPGWNAARLRDMINVTHTEEQYPSDHRRIEAMTGDQARYALLALLEGVPWDHALAGTRPEKQPETVS